MLVVVCEKSSKKELELFLTSLGFRVKLLDLNRTSQPPQISSLSLTELN